MHSWTVAATETKSATVRLVPMGPALAAANLIDCSTLNIYALS
jgi:hypothetical protein